MWNLLCIFIGRNKRSPQTAPGAPPPVGAPPPGAPPVNQCTATNKNGIRRDCIFPFKYKSRTYYECTEVGSDTGAWCATQVGRDGITADGTSYVDCDPGCPGYRYGIIHFFQNINIHFIQLHEYEADPYFLENFQNNMSVCLIIPMFCKSW